LWTPAQLYACRWRSVGAVGPLDAAAGETALFVVG